MERVDVVAVPAGAGLLGGVTHPRLLGVRMGLETQRSRCGQHLEQERQSKPEPVEHLPAEPLDRLGGEHLGERHPPAVARRARMRAEPQLRLGRRARHRPPLELAIAEREPQA